MLISKQTDLSFSSKARYTTVMKINLYLSALRKGFLTAGKFTPWG